MAERIGGIITVKIDDSVRRAKGSWTVNPGATKKEMIVGSDGPHGYTEIPQPPSISGTITDQSDLDVSELFSLTDSTVSVEFANGKTFTLNEAVFSADGEVTSEAGEIECEFQGTSGAWT